jgi:histone H3/H4
MAAKKNAKKAPKAKAPAELIISKSRTKAAVQKCNVSSDFYGALDGAVRTLIQGAEDRATANGRKTLRPQDL